MKKIIASLVGLFLLGFLVSGAQAFTVGFDSTGSNTNFDDLGGFKFNGVGGLDLEFENAPTGGDGELDIWTTVNYETLEWSESFTLMLTQGLNDSGTTEAFYGTSTDIFIDIVMSGHIEDLDVTTGEYLSVIDEGAATMYVDVVSDHDFITGEDTVVATMDLLYGDSFAFENSLLGQNGAVSIDVAFEFLTANPLFWDDSAEYLIGQNFLLAMTQGDLTLREFIPDTLDPTSTEDQYLGWSVIAVDSDFSQIPEPSTFLLFGLGLLSVARVGRKK